MSFFFNLTINDLRKIMRARDGEAFNAYSRQSTVDCVLLLLLPLRVDVASWARRADAMMPWCKLQLIQSRKSRRKNNNLPVDRSRGQEFQIKSPRRAIRIYKFNFTAEYIQQIVIIIIIIVEWSVSVLERFVPPLWISLNVCGTWP